MDKILTALGALVFLMLFYKFLKSTDPGEDWDEE
jgi:hypothetical protein